MCQIRRTIPAPAPLRAAGEVVAGVPVRDRDAAQRGATLGGDDQAGDHIGLGRVVGVRSEVLRLVGNPQLHTGPGRGVEHAAERGAQQLVLAPGVERLVPGVTTGVLVVLPGPVRATDERRPTRRRRRLDLLSIQAPPTIQGRPVQVGVGLDVGGVGDDARRRRRRLAAPIRLAGVPRGATHQLARVLVHALVAGCKRRLLDAHVIRCTGDDLETAIEALATRAVRQAARHAIAVRAVRVDRALQELALAAEASRATGAIPTVSAAPVGTALLPPAIGDAHRRLGHARVRGQLALLVRVAVRVGLAHAGLEAVLTPDRSQAAVVGPGLAVAARDRRVRARPLAVHHLTGVRRAGVAVVAVGTARARRGIRQHALLLHTRLPTAVRVLLALRLHGQVDLALPAGAEADGRGVPGRDALLVTRALGRRNLARAGHADRPGGTRAAQHRSAAVVEMLPTLQPVARLHDALGHAGRVDGRVDAPRGGVAGVLGVRVLVVADERLELAPAAAHRAGVRRAGIAIVAHGHTPLARVGATGVVLGARVLVVARLGIGCVLAHARHAGVVRAEVAIIAVHPITGIDRLSARPALTGGTTRAHRPALATAPIGPALLAVAIGSADVRLVGVGRVRIRLVRIRLVHVGIAPRVRIRLLGVGHLDVGHLVGRNVTRVTTTCQRKRQQDERKTRELLHGRFSIPCCCGYSCRRLADTISTIL